MRRDASITAQQQLPLLLLLLWHTLNHHFAPPWLPWQPLLVLGVTPASLSFFFFICCLSTRKCVNSACAPPVLPLPQPQPLPLFLLPSLINLPLYLALDFDSMFTEWTFVHHMSTLAVHYAFVIYARKTLADIHCENINTHRANQVIIIREVLHNYRAFAWISLEGGKGSLRALACWNILIYG